MLFILAYYDRPVMAQVNEDWQKFVPVIKQDFCKDYKKMYREKGGALPYPFIVPGSANTMTCCGTGIRG